MSTATGTIDTSTTAAYIRRRLAVAALAVALVAISAMRPGDANAQRMTERGMDHACSAASGHVHYNIYDPDAADGFDMFCFLPSGGTVWCHPSDSVLNYLTCE